MTTKDYHPQVLSIILNSKRTLRIAKEKQQASARTSEIFQFYNVSMKNISSDNAYQKAIFCELWLIFFSIVREEISGVADCLDSNTGSFLNNDDQWLSSAGIIYHPELQNELKKLRMRKYKRARELLSNSYFLTFLWKMLVAITQFKKE